MDASRFPKERRLSEVSALLSLVADFMAQIRRARKQVLKLSHLRLQHLIAVRLFYRQYII